jgi:predicted Holliday junction resolvase-like endonuclease
MGKVRETMVSTSTSSEMNPDDCKVAGQPVALRLPGIKPIDA